MMNDSPPKALLVENSISKTCPLDTNSLQSHSQMQSCIQTLKALFKYNNDASFQGFVYKL